ncbi:hypothetical protein LTR94_038227, partial [Friedmanniomyces endolithicus]
RVSDRRRASRPGLHLEPGDRQGQGRRERRAAGGHDRAEPPGGGRRAGSGDVLEQYRRWLRDAPAHLAPRL